MDAEIFFAVVVFGLGMLPIARHLWRTRPRPVGVVVIITSLVAAAAVAWAMTRYRPAVTPEAEHTNRPTRVNEAGYASSQTCKQCHPGEYGTWFSSYHRTMTQLVEPETVIPAFDREVEVYGVTYRLERRGDTYWIEMPDPADAGAPRVSKRLIMSTGSHHQQAFWLDAGEGRPPEISPIVYVIGEDKWVPMGDIFLRPEGGQFQPDWNQACVFCHATQTQSYTPAGANREVTEFGIACEACHGPGQAHVASNQSPVHRLGNHLGDEGDATIVNPARLSPERASMVCGQCHALWQRDADARKANHTFRPGGALVSSPSGEVDPADQWSDGMVRSGGREYSGMLDSPCVQAGEMSCLSCHAMHKPAADLRPVRQWADDQLAAGMRDNAACLQCHEMQDVAAHTHHAAGSSGSTCTNCHMPHTSYSLLKAIRSHQIDVPTVQATLETGRPNACNQCHLDKTMGWAADHLHTWYGTERPALTSDQESIAASILWLLRGHAGQRALAAWTLGWEPAKEASGSDWMAPFLAELLADPYPAVRAIAYRSLRQLPGFEDFAYDRTGSVDQRESAVSKAYSLWERDAAGANREARGSATLVGADGDLQRDTVHRLRSERDNQTISWFE